jgi:hypothetical protein
VESKTEYAPLLPGIGFAGYRSFATWQSFLFPTKVTVLAGINNSGKSNVLRFLQEVMPRLGSNGSSPEPRNPELRDLDRPRGFEKPRPFEVGVPVVPGTFGGRQDLARSGGDAQPYELTSFQEGVLDVMSEPDGHYWSRYTLADGRFIPLNSRVEQAMAAWPNWTTSRHSAVLWTRFKVDRRTPRT